MTQQADQNTTNNIEGGPAGFFRILAAIGYDAVVMLAIYLIIGFVFVLFSRGDAVLSGHPLYPVLQSTLLFSLFGYLTYSWTRSGQTIGMLAWKIKLTSTHTEQVSLWQALLRFFSACLGLGNVWVLIDRDMRSWHDIFSDTRLICLYTNRPAK